MKYLLFIFFIIIPLIGIPQSNVVLNKQQHWSVSANYQFGKILPTTDFVKGDNLLGQPLEKFQAYTVKMLWQNPGYKNWQKVYRAPYYGGGVSIGDFFNPKEIGFPVSVYGILGIPIIRWQKVSLYSEFQFGMTSNWKHYDSISNPKNLVIGGGLTVHLNIGIQAFYSISNHFDLGAGIGFIHFSNGGFERPNRGFNIYAPSIELKYHFNERPEISKIGKAGRLERSNDLYFMAGYGDHQLVEHELDTNYFAVAGLSAIYFTQLSNAFKLGFGADLNHWWGLTALPDGTIGPRTIENFTLGTVIQPEFVIGKLNLVGGIGIYAIHHKYGNFSQTYQRLGVSYAFYKNVSFGVNVRSINFMLAEFLEFNLGYRIKWMKQN